MTTVVSRHTNGANQRADIRAWNMNAWCTVTGNPFLGPVALMPNGPDMEAVAVEFGPLRLGSEIDTITFFLSGSDSRDHGHRHLVEVGLVNRSESAVDTGQVTLAKGERATVTLKLGQAKGQGVSPRLAVTFEEFAGGANYGKVSLAYLLAYADNELVRLFNAAGSDKGTETRVGMQGFPHCYGVAYFDLFEGLRSRRFRMLEIGLQSPDGTDAAPTDAPSLRVWRDFFPDAEIYGYDIDDFSFFEQERTTTVVGDQSSREQLEGFVSRHGGDFALVLDDGSHASSHQQISLGSLFPSVEPGGLYVIEDLHWQPFRESPTTAEVLRGFMESGRLDTPFLDKRERRYLEGAIERVELQRPNDSEFAVIHKGAA